ncbi:MAG: primosomal protein N' [Deltaproteobacteria bacterium]|nr:primosomal protein N' [Deltaproteobacteria bacterium]
MQGGERSFAQVVVPSPLNEPLTYAIPPALRKSLRIGMRVLVPLGKRKVAGIVSDFLAQTPRQQIKEILAVLDDRPVLDSSLLKLIDWASHYYLAPVGEVLATILPPALRVHSLRVLAAKPGAFPEAGELERKILEQVRRRKGRLTIRSLARIVPEKRLNRALERLSAMGALEIKERMSSRKSMGGLESALATPPADGAGQHGGSPQGFTLTPEQEQAMALLGARIEAGGFETFLLCGVTGSGKTEVYLRSMELVRRANQKSLILAPEISLTPQLLDRLDERFPSRVGVLHSALTPSERWDQWWRILDGRVDVVIGARSAVFAPLPHLGLIIVDEEHDSSYKQEEGLRYHARDLAVVRGKLIGCPVILGSATPAVESFENCRQRRYRLLELSQRVEQRPLPSEEMVDMRGETRDGGRRTEDRERVPGRRSSVVGLFSSRLKEALQVNLARGRQSLIFLNRRGFANFLQCRKCGYVRRCPHCSVSLTLHLREHGLYCHHCGFRELVRDLCPGCGNPSLTALGFGTETVEQEISRLMPEARIARMDRDTTTKRGSQERLVRRWQKGEIDILVGTQMITKGHDVAGVTLVGVILADLSLNLPDFRAAEKTFQLLTQVAGRAGRGQEPGQVIIQTFAPDHYALRYVTSHDYKGFFASEIEFRRALNYPPFRRLVGLRLEGPSPQDAKAKAQLLGDALRQHDGPGIHERVEILGPAPAPIEKLRSRYRWQILLKGENSPSVLGLAKRARALFPRSHKTRLFIDVDPYNML